MYMAFTLIAGALISLPIWTLLVLPIWRAVTSESLAIAKADAAWHTAAFLSLADFATPLMISLLFGIAISNAAMERFLGGR